MVPKRAIVKRMSARDSFMAGVRNGFLSKPSRMLARVSRTHPGSGRLKCHALLKTGAVEYHFEVEGDPTLIDSRLGGSVKRKRGMEDEDEDNNIEVEDDMQQDGADEGDWVDEGDADHEEEAANRGRNGLERQRMKTTMPMIPEPGPSSARRGTRRTPQVNLKVLVDALSRPPDAPPRRREIKRLRSNVVHEDEASSSVITPTPNGITTKRQNQPDGLERRKSGAVTRSRYAAEKGKGKAKATKYDPEVDQITAGIDGFNVFGVNALQEAGSLVRDLSPLAGPSLLSVGNALEVIKEDDVEVEIVGHGIDVSEWLNPIPTLDKVGTWLDSTIAAGSPAPVDFPGSRAPSATCM